MKLKYPKFVSYLISHGDQISTAERRERRIRMLENHINVNEPDIGEIYSYVEMRLRSGLKKKSVRLEISDLSHWCKYIGKPISKDDLPVLKKEPDPDPFIPEPEEISKMREFCLSRKDKYTWARNLCMMDMLIATGMRAGELIHANLEDYKNSTLYIRSEKGEKDRTVPLPGKLTAEVDEYIEKYRYHSDSRALFTTRTGRYNYNKLRQLIKYIGVHSGVPDIHPHSFRHYYATTLVRLGVDIRRVQILVGHARIETTTRYTHLTQKEVGEAVKESVEALFRLNRQMTDFEWEQLGADPNVVEALGFERCSMIAPIYHYKRNVMRFIRSVKRRYLKSLINMFNAKPIRLIHGNDYFLKYMANVER